MSKKSYVWSIRVLQEVTLKVGFEDEVTAEQAMDLVYQDSYDFDVIDESDHEIKKVISAE